MSGSLLAGIVISDGASSSSGGSNTIQELYADPASPSVEEVWILATGGGTPIADGTPIGLLLGLTYTNNTGGGSGPAIADGTPIGMLLALTYTDNTGGSFTYQLSYKTIEGPIVRTTLS